jgi:hypothetical protein
VEPPLVALVPVPLLSVAPPADPPFGVELLLLPADEPPLPASEELEPLWPPPPSPPLLDLLVLSLAPPEPDWPPLLALLLLALLDFPPLPPEDSPPPPGPCCWQFAASKSTELTTPKSAPRFILRSP